MVIENEAAGDAGGELVQTIANKALVDSVDRNVRKYDVQFVEEGGIRERMTAARLEKRTSQKEQIALLQAENAALRREIAALKRRLGE